MATAVKVAISLPPPLYQAVERERSRRSETRSEFFRHALEAYLRQAEEQKAVERYVRGYQEHPETDEDARWVSSASNAALAAEPWE